MRPPESDDLINYLTEQIPILNDGGIDRLFDLALHLPVARDYRRPDGATLLIGLAPRLDATRKRKMFDLTRDWRFIDLHLDALAAIRDAVEPGEMRGRVMSLVPEALRESMLNERVMKSMGMVLDAESARTLVAAAAGSSVPERAGALLAALPFLPDLDQRDAWGAVMAAIPETAITDLWPRLIRLLPPTALEHALDHIARADMEPRTQDDLFARILARDGSAEGRLRELLDDPRRHAAIVAASGQDDEVRAAAEPERELMSFDEAFAQLAAYAKRRHWYVPDWFGDMVEGASGTHLDRIVEAIDMFEQPGPRFNCALKFLELRPDHRRPELLRLLCENSVSEYEPIQVIAVLRESEKQAIMDHLSRDPAKEDAISRVLFPRPSLDDRAADSAYPNPDALRTMYESGYLRDRLVRLLLVSQRLAPQDRPAALKGWYLSRDELKIVYFDLPQEIRLLMDASFRGASDPADEAARFGRIAEAGTNWSAEAGATNAESRAVLEQEAAPLLAEVAGIDDEFKRATRLILLLPFLAAEHLPTVRSEIDSISDGEVQIRAKARLALAERLPDTDRIAVLDDVLADFDKGANRVLIWDLLKLAPPAMLPRLLIADIDGSSGTALEQLIARGSRDDALACLDTIAASQALPRENRPDVFRQLCTAFSPYAPDEEAVRHLALLAGTSQVTLYGHLSDIAARLRERGSDKAARAIATSAIDVAGWWRT